MGVTLGDPNHRPSRRRRGVPRYGAMAEINMTPFIDVMLVLLIVFMVAAPLLATGVPIELPQTRAAGLTIDQRPVAVAINERGEIYVMDQLTTVEELVARVQAAAPNGPEDRIYVRGARNVPYGQVAQVMSLITAAGFRKVALVTEQER